MPFAVQLKASDKVTPLLYHLTKKLSDRAGLHRAVADEWEVLVAGHITEAARTRHKTATRLGASPTGYLEKKAGLVESRASDASAEVDVPGEIFARVSGDVTVKAVNAKNLAIPANKTAFGKRPGEIDGLKFVQFGKDGVKALVKFSGSGKDREMDVFFWLKPSVVLPQDRELLPDDEVLWNGAEIAAEIYVAETAA